MADAEEPRDEGKHQDAPATAATPTNGSARRSQSAKGSSAGKAGSRAASANGASATAKTGTTGKRASPAATPKRGKAAQAAASDPIAMLKDDHRKVEGLFASFETARNRAQRQRIAGDICAALKLHAELEERIFYPATRDESDKDDKLDEAQVEHDAVKLLIRDIEGAAPDSPFYAAKVKVLSEYVRHHVTEEEAPDGILEAARKAGVDLARIGEEMARLRERLERDPSQLRVRTLALGTPARPAQAKENDMARNTGNGEMERGTRGGMRDRGASERGARGYDDHDYDRSRGAQRRGDDRNERGREGDAASARDSTRDRAGGERPRRFGGAEGFNEASRRAAEAQGGGRRSERQSRGSAGKDDRTEDARGQRSRERTMRASRDWSSERGSRWEGGPQSRH